MEEHFHFLLYKPYGYLSQFVNNGQKKNSKKLLGSLFDFPEGTMPVGRLDEKSEGLLLLTTDGKVCNYFCSSGIEKEYYSLVDGDIPQDSIEKMKRGVKIGLNGKKYTTNSCVVHKLPSPPELPARGKKIRDARHGPVSWVSITLQEGKYRQVRKMTSTVGYPTLRLVRVRIGNLQLQQMQPGEVVPLQFDDEFIATCHEFSKTYRNTSDQIT
ncbi:pseudouridine synthase [Aquimarina brevivitae]|uniref:Pseudouridine synthase n=1 Tax=Aquimarina brevivitae TaxID=323412 RepID=A0A4Q7P2B5_9FLAO|nr:pseudouridine synthase [Aquimarina brevivitae]RZS93894.1 23S rRNA pseudouridine2457 synthase [Aquimarina brevivitae]